MTAPWPNQSYPATPAPALVPQQENGMRVLRVLLVGLVLAGWFGDSVGAAAPPTMATGVTLDLGWSDLAGLATLILLIVGPQPRWATKWAWFWLLGVGPLTAVFLLLEPVPVWQSEPARARPSRLTGGWAFLLAIFSGIIVSVLASLVVLPWLAAMGGTWGIVTPFGWLGG